MRKPTKPPSLQDTMAANASALRGLCAMAGRPMPPELEAPARAAQKVRATPVHSSPHDLEAAVMQEVSGVIGKHPKVLFAVRQNSGAVQMELKGGNTAPVWFYRWARRRIKMRITDFWGMLTDGRMFAIESKRRSWTKPSGEREEEQHNFILTVQNAGGVGGFVTSAEQALEILNK